MKIRDTKSLTRFKLAHRQTLLASAIAALLVPMTATAFEMNSGDFNTSIDTTLTLGTTFRTQAADPRLVGIANKGTARTVNADDGNLNYERGRPVSTVAKISQDIGFKYGDYGAFLRGNYFYDFTNANKVFFGALSEEKMTSDAKLLDAFIYAGLPTGTTIRLGRQVVSWGESSFIGNGLNVINTFDVTKLRVPGAELKDALIATPMVWISQEITNSISLEGVWLSRWDQVQIDPRGAFFSTSDALSDDGSRVVVTFGRRVDGHFPNVEPGPGFADLQAWVPRGADVDAKDNGQYGLVMRLFAAPLNNTEFGLYFLNYHSRTPIFSTQKGTTSNALGGVGTSRYFAEYPENIHVAGVSFNTSLPAGIALQGEYSYRPEQPMQVSSSELVMAALNVPGNQVDPTAAAPAGTIFHGNRNVRMNQLQFTLTKAFGPTLGATQFVVVGEVGYNRMSLPSDVFLNGPGVQLAATQAAATAAAAGSVQPYDAFATANSWGYRLVSRLDFDNALGAASLSPRIVFAHDVNGVGINFNKGVMTASFGLGLNYQQVWTADLSYTSYFGGKIYAGTDTGAIPASQSANWAFSSNPILDRDNVSFSVSYAF